MSGCFYSLAGGFVVWHLNWPAVAIFVLLFLVPGAGAQSLKKEVPDSIMQRIFQEIKTPYKYGLVLVPENDSKKIDCPSVFRQGNNWYMTYLVFDGRGYET